MTDWHPSSLYPIIGLATLLASGVLLRGRKRWPIAVYCLSLAVWAVAVLLAARPDTAELGGRLLMVGFFIPASLSHVIAHELGQERPGVWLNYVLAGLMTGSSVLVPGLYLQDAGRSAGPLFLPMFVLTLLAGAIPLSWLWRAEPEPGRRETRRYLLLAGSATSSGGLVHILLMLSDNPYPLGLYLMLSGMGLLTYVALATELPSFSRFTERSQRYTFTAAMLSTVWMLALLSVSASTSAGPAWSWQSAGLLFVLTLTAQPLLTELRSQLTRLVVPGADAEALTRALANSEARAEHAERLAEIGRLASAVAHEVRNPLGVISACTTLLERSGSDPELLDEVRGAVSRADRFASDLLDYGRPSPLRTHPVSLADLASLAEQEVTVALRALSDDLHATFEHQGDATAAVDGAQITRLLATLFDNALLAGARTIQVTIEEQASTVRVEVSDDGPGVPEALVDTLFLPFVTGRGRDSVRPGTGLGLAIAASIAERHQGSLRLVPVPGGSCFRLVLPSRPRVSP